MRMGLDIALCSIPCKQLIYTQKCATDVASRVFDFRNPYSSKERGCPPILLAVSVS